MVWPLGVVALGIIVLALLTLWAVRPVASPASSPEAPADAHTTALTTDPATVSDGTATFVVTAQPVSSSVVVNVNSYVWSASPGQVFLADTLTVQNPTSSPESLSDFDDPTSGLAADVDFVMAAADAATYGFSSVCGADPGYPANVCPITFGQGLTVDSNSATQAGTANETLAPGATAQISVSYGPVSGKVPAGKVSLSFHHGATAPLGL